MRTHAAACCFAALLIAGCGGSGGDDAAPAETVLLDETRTLSGGTAAVLQTNITVQVYDVRYTVTKPGAVTICFDATWTQNLKKPATIRVSYAGKTVSTAGVTGSNVVAIGECFTINPSPGTQPATTQIDVATDCRCDDALGGYTATAHWRITQQ